MLEKFTKLNLSICRWRKSKQSLLIEKVIEDLNRQTFWCRSSRLLIYQLPQADVKLLNEMIEQATSKLKPSQIYATPASKITEWFCVFDIEQTKCHIIYVHYVDYRPRQTNIREVVRFSKACHSPCRAEKLRLTTPSYYWDQENLRSGIADPDENTLRKDTTPLIRDLARIPYGSSFQSKTVLSSSIEPWLYCTSHFPLLSMYRKLKTRFSDKYDYDAATEIKDVNDFAMWLGIEYALQIDKGNGPKLDGLNPWAINFSPDLKQLRDLEKNIDAVVHVYHGPVHYEDESGVIATDDDWVDIHGAVRACFTKRTEFADQSEYRFAVSTLGMPNDKVLWLDVSEELRGLTSPMR